MRKHGLFSSAATTALAALGIQAAGEDEDGQAGPPPAPPETPAPRPEDLPPEGGPLEVPAEEEASAGAAASAPAASGDTVTLAAAAEAGAAAERERVATVFASAEALANPGLAVWMLVNGPQASAESIVAQMKTAPVAPAAAAPAPSIPPTNISVGSGEPGEGESDALDVWGQVQRDQAAASAPIVPASAAAGLNGRTTVTAALPRTGN